MFRRTELSNFNVMPPESPPRVRNWRNPATTAAVTALLALFWWLAISASIQQSHTSDELPHLTAGYAYDRFGDFRMQPENGNLPQRLFGLPSLVAHARFPMDDTLWRHSTFWLIGWDFFYSLNNPTDWLVLCARALNALFGVALGLFIFAIARAWHGRAGGLLALGFYTFAPSFLEHSALATSDMSATFFLTLAPWLFWRHLAQRDLGSGMLAGLVSGLTLVAKFNGILLAPIYALLLVADVWLRPAAPGVTRPSRLARNFTLALGQAALAVAVIWAFFNFRFSARGPGMPELAGFAWGWPEMFALIGWKHHLIQAALDWKLFPEAWLYGLANVLAGAAQRPAFFAGELSLHGWWQYFPAIFLLKTPLAMLGALLLALGAGLSGLRAAVPGRSGARWQRACPLVVSAGVVWIVALTSNLNIGDRHILADYPVLFIALGGLAARRWLTLTAGVLVLAEAQATLAIRPHYLAAFNALGGGPAHAYRLFADSALDWGQDLPALRSWLAAERRPGERFYLGYFSNAWPPHYGVRPDHFLPADNYIVQTPTTWYEYEPGLYCLSATLLAEVYSRYRGPWTSDYERRYRELQAFCPEFAQGRELEGFIVYNRLRFARLCKYLQNRPPDGDAGHSILIFRLTAAELHTALEAPVTGGYPVRER